MKLLIAFGLAIALAVPASAQVQVRGYVKKDGTYVAPHVRSSPNNTTADNYGTRGNVNPYTGERGTRDPAPDYERPRTNSNSSTTPCYYNCRR